MSKEKGDWLRVDFYDPPRSDSGDEVDFNVRWDGAIPSEMNWDSFLSERKMQDGSPSINLPNLKVYWLRGLVLYIHRDLIE